MAAAPMGEISEALGNLAAFVGTTGEDLTWAAQRVGPESFANRGLYVDPPVVAAVRSM